MDLSLPLRSLIPSLDSDVLAVLAGTESALGATQITRLSARGSRQGVTQVLDRLVSHGLVLAHPTNKGHSYQLNREHVLAGALQAALNVRPVVLEILSRYAEQLDPPAVHASVFGSLARGDGNTDSDIDLLIVTPTGHDPHDPAWAAQLRAMQDRVLRATGNRLEVLVLTMQSLRRAVRNREPLIGSLTAESLRLHGPTFTELLPANVKR